MQCSSSDRPQNVSYNTRFTHYLMPAIYGKITVFSWSYDGSLFTFLVACKSRPVSVKSKSLIRNSTKFICAFMRKNAPFWKIMQSSGSISTQATIYDHYPSADPEGGQAVRTPPPPWKIINYMGFSRVGHCSSSSISPTLLVLRSLMQVQRAAVLCTNVLWDQLLPR